MGTANTHTHSLTSTKIWGKGGGKGDSTGVQSIKLEITTLIENKKMEKKERKKEREKKKTTKEEKTKNKAVIALRTLDIRIHS